MRTRSRHLTLTKTKPASDDDVLVTGILDSILPGASAMAAVSGIPHAALFFLMGVVASLGMLSLGLSVVRGGRRSSSQVLMEDRLEFGRLATAEPFVE